MASLIGLLRGIRRTSRQRFRPTLEFLENRVTPTVTAIENNGVLSVTLDATDDAATITGTSAAGDGIQVAGTGFTTDSFTGITAINVNGIGAGSGQSLELDSTGPNVIILTGMLTINNIQTTTVATAATLQASALVETGGSQVNLAASVDAADGVTISDRTVLDADVTLTAKQVTLGSTVDGGHNLLIDGDASFHNTIGSSTPLSSLSVVGATTLGSSAVSVTTSGQQTYSGAFVTQASSTFVGSGVEFDGTLDGFTAGGQHVLFQGDVTFEGLVGSQTPLGSITATGNTTAHIDTTAVNTTGAQSYQTVLVDSGVGTTATLTASTATFGQADAATVGGEALNIVGNAQFNGNVGGFTPFAALSVSGATLFSQSLSVNTTTSAGGTGTQTYTGAGGLTLGTSATTAQVQANIGDGAFNLLTQSFAVKLNGSTPGSGYDQLVVAATGAGAIDLGSNNVLQVTLGAGFTPIPGESFTIIDNQGSQSIAGIFKNLPEGSTFTADGVHFHISYVGGTGNDVVLTVVTATHFAVSSPAGATAGTAFSVTVTALDQFNQTFTGYSGTVHFTSSDGQAVLPADAALTNGTGSFSATLKTTGSQTITATDTVDSTITGTTNTIAVGAAAATHFSVSAPSAATAGTAFSFTVTALDQFNNTASGYTGTVHFTSSDAQAVLPADAALTNGTGSFSATLKTTGSQTITATDTVDSTITGATNTIAVGAAAATHFTVSAPSTATAGTAFSYTVTALDQFNNTATGYTGTVHFTSSDAQAVLPANATLTAGVGTFSATLKTAGSQTITATDTVTPAITGVTSSITVSAVAATHLSVSLSGSVTAGTAFTITVKALDQFNNVAPGYTGTVHFTSSDSKAVLPADGTLTNGVGTFSVTLKTSGSQTITATDTVTATITGVSGAINVSAAATTHFAVSAPTTIQSGTALSFTVTAQDQFNNTTPAYTGTVHFTSSDGVAVLPGDSTLTNGVGTFSATLKSGGSQTITATDTATLTTTGTSNAITVQTAAAITSASSATFVAASPGTFTVTTTGTPNPTLTESGTLPAGVKFLDNGNGTATLSGTPTSIGTFTFTITAHNGIGTDATQTFKLTVSGIPAYATTPNQRFVAQVYVDLLNRFVEQAALNFWVTPLDQGVAHSVIVLAIETNGGNEYRADVVNGIYTQYLNRPAEASAIQHWVSFLVNGGTDEQLTATIVGSFEYFGIVGKNSFTQFPTALYQDALGRAIDANSLTAASNGLATGLFTPTELAALVLTSAEYYGHFVGDSYETFLHRPADAAGLANFTKDLQAGMTDEQFLAILIGSPEYQQTRVGN